jgi:hypothetical protein
MRRALPALLVVALALPSACLWRGVDDLTDESNTELIVTGLEAGDRLAVELGEERVEQTVAETDGDRISIFGSLPPGEHSATVEHERAGERACGELEFDVEQGAEATLSVDVRSLEECDEDDEDPPDEPEPDAGPGDDPPSVILDGRFVHLEETSSESGCTDSCEETTVRVDDEGDVRVEGPEAFEGSLPAAELVALAALAVSPEADALFAGDDPDCPLASPPPDEDPVELERRVRDTETGDESTERVDATGCEGFAERLRERLELAASLVAPETP